jgi:hypothetical protein
VLERIVEHWLTRAGERSYEIAFVQLLLAEGWRILQVQFIIRTNTVKTLRLWIRTVACAAFSSKMVTSAWLTLRSTKVS